MEGEGLLPVTLLDFSFSFSDVTLLSLVDLSFPVRSRPPWTRSDSSL